MDKHIIVLGGADYEVPPIPLGKIKKLLPAINRVGNRFSQGELTEESIDDIILCISLALNKTVDEIEALPASFDELTASIEICMSAAGLKAKGEFAGETKAAS